MNSVNIMGRLTNEPELRTTSNGNSVTSFCIAVDDSYSKDKTYFIDCVAWRKTAEFIERYFHKGKMIAISGSIQTREYEDKQGNKRKAVEVVANDVSFCGDSNLKGETKTANSAYKDAFNKGAEFADPPAGFSVLPTEEDFDGLPF